MKIALLLGAALLVVVVAVVAIGAALPRGHVARRRARFARPAAEVFALLSDFAAMPAWRKDLKRVELLAPEQGKPGYREIGSSGAVAYRVEALEPPRLLRTRIESPLPYGGTWTLVVEPAGESACTLTITEDGEVYNPVFRFVSRFVIGHTATIDAYLKSLAALLGEPLAVESGIEAAEFARGRRGKNQAV